MECEFCHRTGIQIKKCTQLNMYLCSKHWNQFSRYGKLFSDEKKIKTCEICGKTNKTDIVHWCEKAKQYLCQKHIDQINRLGFIKERTKRDMNLYVIHDDYAEILFEDQENNIVGSTCIDLEDVNKCKEHKWMITEVMGNTQYVKAIIDNKNTSLHRFVLNYNGDNVVDHINRNGLDNRKNNLRIVSNSENCVNSKTRSATGEKNIYYKNNKYQVQVIRNYKSVYIETFDSIQEAIIARDTFINNYNTLNNRIV